MYLHRNQPFGIAIFMQHFTGVVYREVTLVFAVTVAVDFDRVPVASIQGDLFYPRFGDFSGGGDCHAGGSTSSSNIPECGRDNRSFSWQKLHTQILARTYDDCPPFMVKR